MKSRKFVGYGNPLLFSTRHLSSSIARVGICRRCQVCLGGRRLGSIVIHGLMQSVVFSLCIILVLPRHRHRQRLGEMPRKIHHQETVLYGQLRQQPCPSPGLHDSSTIRTWKPSHFHHVSGGQSGSRVRVDHRWGRETKSFQNKMGRDGEEGFGLPRPT